MNLRTLLASALAAVVSAQQQPNATGAPLPGTNVTGLSTEGIATVVTVVGRFLTFVAEPTVFAWGPNTYSVTAPTTLTITDCPCTITTTRCLGPDCYYKGPGPHAMTIKADTLPTANASADVVDVKTKAAVGPGPSASAPAKAVVVSGGVVSVRGGKAAVVGAVAGAVAAAVGGLLEL